MLFVRRVDYKAHVRHTGKIEARISNEDAIYSALLSWADRAPGRRILNGMFHNMTMAAQLSMVQEACLMLGAHGCVIQSCLSCALLRTLHLVVTYSVGAVI